MSEATSFGKYRLIAELGHGGMSDVFLALQAGPAGSGFNKLTVIKRLRANLAEDADFVTMLVDEAAIAARLNHPNVVQTNEVGEVGGQYFIAMEYLDGQPFHRIQHRCNQRAKAGQPPPLSREQQIVVLMEALNGLHHAHELLDFDGSPLRIVHRDITPHNIFVTYDGQVKVVDFGIAKAQGRSSETRQGVLKGKVRYMAPEQALGQEVDRRADIFAAGVILWEIVAGRRMWKDMDDLGILRTLVGGEFAPAPSTLAPNVPPALDRICAKALARSREDRYETADQFRVEIEQYLAEAGELVGARRKLATAVGELFVDKRAEIRTVIERQLAAFAGRPPSDPRSSMESSRQTSSSATLPSFDSSASLSGSSPSTRTMPGAEPRSLSSPSIAPSSVTASNTSISGSISGTSLSGASLSGPHDRGAGGPASGHSSMQTSSIAPRSRVRWVALGLVAASLVIAGVSVLALQQPPVVVGQTTGEPVVQDPPALATPSAAATASTTAATEAPVEQISLRLAGSPPTTTVRIDDGPPKRIPLELQVPRDDRDHFVHLEAAGYVGKTEVVRFARDTTINVRLEEVASARKDPRAPTTPRTPTAAAPSSSAAPTPK